MPEQARALTKSLSLREAERRSNPASWIATPSFLGLAMTNKGVIYPASALYYPNAPKTARQGDHFLRHHRLDSHAEHVATPSSDAGRNCHTAHRSRPGGRSNPAPARPDGRRGPPDGRDGGLLEIPAAYQAGDTRDYQHHHGGWTWHDGRSADGRRLSAPAGACF